MPAASQTKELNRLNRAERESSRRIEPRIPQEAIPQVWAPPERTRYRFSTLPRKLSAATAIAKRDSVRLSLIFAAAAAQRMGKSMSARLQNILLHSSIELLPGFKHFVTPITISVREPVIKTLLRPFSRFVEPLRLKSTAHL